MFDWNARMEYYKRLPSKIQEWYDSDAAGNVADTLVHDLHMKPENKVPLINIVGDTVLGLLSPADLPNQILNYIPMPLPLARVLAEHLLMLLAQAQVSASSVPATAPAPQAPSSPAQNPRPAPVTPSALLPLPQRPAQTGAPISYREPVPATANPPAPLVREIPPRPRPWQHTYPANSGGGTQAPATPLARPATVPPLIPQYQRPLTDVPQYRNANLYQKPGGTPEPPSNLPI